MSYKIVVDSCCELPQDLKNDERFERVPLTLRVGDIYEREDDDTFDQREFLDAVASCPECPKSACPSPERYMNAYRTDAERVYVVTLTSKLSGSYNSAVLGKNLYLEKYGAKDIHVVDSLSASCGEMQIAYKAMELEEEGLPFDEIARRLDAFVREMKTLFVLHNLETLRKNGRLSLVKAIVATTLNIKPVMWAIEGEIVQFGQCIGTKKALTKMADTALENVKDTESRRLMISHCNNPDGAEYVRSYMTKNHKFRDVQIIDMAGISSMYSNDGGMIMTL